LVSSGSHPDEVLALPQYRYSYRVQEMDGTRRYLFVLCRSAVRGLTCLILAFAVANTQSTASYRTVRIRWGTIESTSRDTQGEHRRPSLTAFEQMKTAGVFPPYSLRSLRKGSYPPAFPDKLRKMSLLAMFTT
jgi:hypothetical protein